MFQNKKYQRVSRLFENYQRLPENAEVRIVSVANVPTADLKFWSEWHLIDGCSKGPKKLLQKAQATFAAWNAR